MERCRVIRAVEERQGDIYAQILKRSHEAPRKRAPSGNPLLWLAVVLLICAMGMLILAALLDHPVPSADPMDPRTAARLVP